ncbi:intracellular protein transport protein USO1-like [Macadamia integrifolia]|uniref:intracellular protein transport protein USO1-like n=1 Tax=Macadamia integrifolia TaxID=60698 RepID=UPI001C4EEDCE|nr:intracellular protein transport protein USO1-like [Macadamia integrifolia]
MFYPSSGRNQRPKGFKVKQAFQVILLLAVSIWLLYQIKHSHSKPKEYGGEQKKLSSEHGSMVLGRKGGTGFSEGGVYTDSIEVNHVGEGQRKKDGGGGDDELDRNIEEKAQDESFINGHEDLQGNITNDEKDGAKELETQNRESMRSEENNLGTQVRDRDEAVSDNAEEPLEKGHEDSKEGLTNIIEQEDREKVETQNDEPKKSETSNPDTEVIDTGEAMGSDKGKEEQQNKEHEDSKESFTDHAEQEDRKFLERQNEETEKSEKVNPDTEVIDREEAVSSDKGEEEALNKRHEDSKESFTEHEEQGDREMLERQNDEPENSEKGNPDTKVIDTDEAVGLGKDSKGNAEDIALQHSETENITVPGQTEMGDELQGFHDENGVPQDGNDLLNSHGNGTTSDEQAKDTNQDHETISSLENQTQVAEITNQTAGESSNSSQADEPTDRGMSTDNLVIKQGEFQSEESGTFSVVKAISNNILEGSKTKSNDNVENSSQSGDNSDVSSIKGSSESSQDATFSSESSSSSQPENEEATVIETLPQAENAADSKE